jgi:UTP:GlnB (protein PII) uridylyltransferase
MTCRTMKIWTDHEKAALANLYHTARTALASSEKRPTRYDQKLWASEAYSTLHPEVSSTCAYKELCRQEAWRYFGGGAYIVKS